MHRKLHRAVLGCSFLAFAACLGCTAATEKSPGSVAAEPAAKLSGAETPSKRTKALAERLRAAGGLRVATTATETIYEPKEGGGFDGFQMNLAAAFAAYLDVPLGIEVVEFTDLFTVNGQVVDRELQQKGSGGMPDLFSRVDLYVHTLAPLPWRREMMRIIPIMPNRVMLLTRKDRTVSSLLELDKTCVAVIKTTSYEAIAEDMAERIGIDIDILRLADDREALSAVADGSARATLRDAAIAIRQMPAYSDLAIGLAVTDLQSLGWAIRPDDEELWYALEEFLNQARADGTYERIWTAYFGISTENYHTLIRYRESGSLALTKEQSAYLEKLRARGLRVAIDRELVRTDGTGRPADFHYALLRSLEQDLDVPIVLQGVSFDRFFSLGGKVPERAKTDPSFAYTPDLLKTTDLYVAPLSPLSWRRTFLRFIPLYPTTLVFLSKRSDRVSSAADLPGRRIALLPNTTYEQWLKEREREAGRPFAYVEAAAAEDAVRFVAEGTADLTIADANLALRRLREFPGLTISPADSEMDMISWAVAKNNDVLGSILDVWIESSKADGRFERIWLEQYGISFAEYLGILTRVE